MSDAQHHDDVKFEPTDAAPGPIVKFLAILTVAMVGFMVMLWYVQAYLIRSEESDKRPGNQLAGTARQEAMPTVRVEGMGQPLNRQGDMEPPAHSVNRTDLPTSAAVLRHSDEQALRDGWTDAGGGKHPPIDEAIRQLVAQLKKGDKP